MSNIEKEMKRLDDGKVEEQGKVLTTFYELSEEERKRSEKEYRKEHGIPEPKKPSGKKYKKLLRRKKELEKELAKVNKKLSKYD